MTHLDTGWRDGNLAVTMCGWHAPDEASDDKRKVDCRECLRISGGLEAGRWQESLAPVHRELEAMG